MLDYLVVYDSETGNTKKKQQKFLHPFRGCPKI